MKNIKNLFLALSLFTLSLNAVASISLEQIKSQLNGDGLVGEVHAVSSENHLFVFTYRNPENFFDYLHMTLVPSNGAMAEQLSLRQRHDKIRLFGSVIETPSPQVHIKVERFDLVSAYTPPVDGGNYDHVGEVPEELTSMERAFFLVHALHEGGKIMVLEYKDVVVPVFVRESQLSLTKDLSRNDVIDMAFKIQKEPGRPTHLKINTNDAEPLKVVQSVMPIHGTPADFTGSLVLFPKSPQVAFDVFAVLEPLAHGLQRQYTLINFDSPDEFKKLRQKCSDAWAKDPYNFRNGRNKLIHNRIKVRAKGIYNQVDANQANVQIILNSADDLEIVE